MRLKLDREDDRAGTGTGKLLFVLLILGWASLGGRWCGVVIGCESDDVTEITLYIGADESAAGGHPTAALWRCPGESFGWHIHWEAGEDDEPDFEGEIYIGGTGVDPITADGADREESGTASALSAGGVYTVECWLKREGGEWCVSNGRTMKIVEVKLECVCHPSACTLLPCKRLCTNAQDCYKKTKWKAKKVKPAGTTATVSGSGPVSLTGIGCSLASLSEGDQFWVEAGGGTGDYTLTLTHNDYDSCPDTDGDKVFKFKFDRTKVNANGLTTGEASKSDEGGWVDSPKQSPPAVTDSAGYVEWTYKVKVVTEPGGQYSGNVEAKGDYTFESDGKMKIWCYQRPVLYETFGAVVDWDIVYKVIFALWGINDYGDSLAAADIASKIGPLEWAEFGDVGHNSEEVSIPPGLPSWTETWDSADDGVDLTHNRSDDLRTYAVGSTEIEVIFKVGSASDISLINPFGTQVVRNTQQIYSVKVEEYDGVFQIIP